ncbi:MAG TPA: folylpolyglutamate synthase/dihydrofolate synthase family protein [Gammaproteobacteria bacterium]|nr:folylpolyglutamate synthase/dihydrofolate synthase family protein [Gammaproteobacteria bacterium]
MRLDTLDQWLEWQTVLHDKAIDLGLDRVREVADRLGIGKIAERVITVAGTNGKGSTVAAYENWLHRAGYSVASYTSPHLLVYNERIRHNLKLASDDELCAAFAAVEDARADTALTYFEFGTLAALYFMQQRLPDFAILEVGLGGRLDAVNIIDADLVHLTPIGLDHQSYLGDDRESIGFEKAGVLRAGVAVVLNDAQPPQSVLAEIDRLDCRCLQLGRDYRLTLQQDDQFLWYGKDREYRLDNVLCGAHQAQNLAGVVAGLSLLLSLDDFGPDQLRSGFHGTRIAGRLQLLQSPLACRLMADVGHNQDAARVLAESLLRLRQDKGRVVVLLGMLKDKQPDLFVEALQPVVDDWWFITLDSERGLDAAALAARVGSQVEAKQHFERIDNALDHALSSLTNQDIMLVTGSFVTVELLLRALSASGEIN